MNLKFQITATPNDGVNLAPTTGSVAMFNLQQALKQAGWVVVQWSDGSTLTTSSAGWSSGASGAGGAGNTNAWIRMTDPSSTREFILHRSTTSVLWRMKVSHSAKFTGGSPTASLPPTATDQLHISTGTDVPAFVSFLPTDATYKQHFVCDADAPYDWAMILMPNGGGTSRRLWWLNGVTGRYPTGEAAPYVVDMNTGAMTASAMGSATVGTQGCGQGYYRKGLGGEAQVIYRAGCMAFTSTTWADNLGTNGIDGFDNPVEVGVGRLSADGNGGFKMWLNSNLVRWSTVPRNDADFLDPTDLASSRFAVWDQMLVRFPTGVAPTT